MHLQLCLGIIPVTRRTSRISIEERPCYSFPGRASCKAAIFHCCRGSLVDLGTGILLHSLPPLLYVLVIFQSVSDAQRLRSLSTGARAALPRKHWSVWCGTGAKRLFHTIHQASAAGASKRS